MGQRGMMTAAASESDARAASPPPPAPALSPAPVPAPPADNRIEPGSSNIPPAKFPATIASESAVDPDAVAAAIVDGLNRGLGTGSPEAVSALFAENCYWRDHLCASWEFRTLRGRAHIVDFLHTSGSGSGTAVAVDVSAPHRRPQIAPVDARRAVSCVQFFISLRTDVGTGQGLVRAIESGDSGGGGWRIFTLFTTLRELSGHEEAVGHRRPTGVEHGEHRDDKTWLETRQATLDDPDPAVLIIGAGQAGLSAAARLGRLSVSTLMIDKEDRVGDNWRSRYRRLVLHDPVWADHLPYLNFPASWPVFTPKDKLGDFFEAYVAIMDLNVWTRTTLRSASWDEAEKRWSVEVERQKGSEKEVRVLSPRHIIQATGHSGKKKVPTIPGMDTFSGSLWHSSDFPGAKPKSNGRRAVVVGSCNSGHDIAQDYYENGYEVTMVQRSSTCVVSAAACVEYMFNGLFDEATQSAVPVEDADLIVAGTPFELQKAVGIQATQLQNEHDGAMLAGLERAGFGLDSGPDRAGLLLKYYQRGGGYYIDVGASRLIAEGKIAVRRSGAVAALRPDGLVLADGAVLAADEIVLATGYGNMAAQARDLLGDAVADRLAGSVWGFDDEGEFRAMWRPCGHPGFWFMGGNLALCRYYSRLLALQIKAREVGLV